MNKKSFIAAAAAMVMLLSLTACNNSGTTSDTSSSDTNSSTVSGTTSQTTPTGSSVLTADTSYDTVVATVKSADGKEYTISFGDFMKEYKYYLAAYNIADDTQEMYASTLTSRREYIVNYLINDKVMETEFEKLGLALTDEDNAQIDADTETGANSIKETLKSQISTASPEAQLLTEAELNAKADEAFNKLLSDCGLSFDDFRNWQKSTVIQAKLSDHLNKDVSVDRSEAVSQAETLIEKTKTEYQNDPSSYDPDTMGVLWLPEGTRNIQHILIKFPDETVTEIMTLRAEGKDADADKLREEKLSELQAEITEVEDKLTAGEDFSALMKEYSDDGDTSAVYVINPGTEKYMDGFAECALSIPAIGDTDTVVTDYGYHIIKYISDAVVDTATYEKHIDGIHQYIIEATKSVNLSNAMKEWRDSYTIEIDRDVLLLGEENTN